MKKIYGINRKEIEPNIWNNCSNIKEKASCINKNKTNHTKHVTKCKKVVTDLNKKKWIKDIQFTKAENKENIVIFDNLNVSTIVVHKIDQKKIKKYESCTVIQDYTKVQLNTKKNNNDNQKNN